jgi:hypothetical protein
MAAGLSGRVSKSSEQAGSDPGPFRSRGAGHEDSASHIPGVPS